MCSALIAISSAIIGLSVLFWWIERDLDRALDQAFNRKRDK